MESASVIFVFPYRPTNLLVNGGASVVPGDGTVTLAKMAGGTDGNLISYDANGDPVAVATGNAGQILTSAGAGAPPTFADAASRASVGKALYGIIIMAVKISGVNLSANTTANVGQAGSSGGIHCAYSESRNLFGFYTARRGRLFCNL